MKLTAGEFGIIMEALRELKKIELKDAETIAGFGSEESLQLAQRCREGAEEIDALVRKLRANVPKIVTLEE